VDVYNASVEHRIRDGEAFILVYCNGDESSFARVEAFAQKIQTYMRGASIVLVENKADLGTSVPAERGKQLAAELGGQLFKTSAKQNTNVEAVFLQAVKDSVYRRQQSCWKTARR
jgi:GTPase SAR1 family protein